SLLVAVGAGAFIYYNTNVLNRYFTQKELEAQLAQYEVLYRQYEELPMPRITDIDMELAIFPDRRRLELQAEITVLNKSAQPIKTVHLELPFEIEFEELTLPGATLNSSDATHRYAIYDLVTPMAPGEQRILSMTGYKQLEGFRAAREDITLVDNGTYFELDTLIPHIGLSRSRLLMDAETRQEYGLDPTLPLGTLDEDPATSRYFNNSPMRADSDLVNFAATVSTVAGQTAVTAGRLTDQWEEGGRRYFRYQTDIPVLPVIPFFSARYAVLRDTWQDPAVAAGNDAGNIDIEIYYHPQHAYHLDLMMQALKEGLASFSTAYGPYQYQQLRVMEYPGYRTNSRSLPTTIAHSEANGFVLRDPAETYESMAHELSHHWWGHQIMSAMVEGAGMGEGLASYSARMLVEAKYGEEFSLHRNFVSANRRYLRGRNRDELGERPVYKSVAQDYLDYSKGESVMYALQDILGEDVVNKALREFVATYKNSTRPYVVTTDFLEILKRTAEPEQLGLIEDLFEKITLYEFSVDAAKAEALDDGRYRVTLDITTAKFYGDVSGKETAAEFNSPVKIGVFTKHPLNRSFRIAEDVIHLELSSPANGKSTVEFIVDKLPLFAGINPYDILIERDTTNNVRPVELSQPPRL
ncbi:MAG: M1 family aminopeptidase, partial [Pseudomonadota bacterium]